MKLGVLSKVFVHPTIEAVFDAIAAVGLECIQLNMESAGLLMHALPESLVPDCIAFLREKMAHAKVSAVREPSRRSP